MNYITFKQKVFSRYRKSTLISKLYAFFGKELQPRKWVFILGCYNSGTTLLAEIFEKHHQLDVLPDEGVMLTDQLPRPEDFGWRRMWWQCENEMQIDKNKASQAAKTIKKHWSHFLKTNPEIVVEKSIANATRIAFFEKHFPNSYFIYIVRDGYAVAEGIKRKAVVMPEHQSELGKDYPIEFPAEQWQRSLDVVAQQKENTKFFLEISYEEFTTDVKETSLRISNFLGIDPFDDQLLQSDFEVHGNKMKVTNQNHKSYVRLNEDEWKAINKIAEKGLKQYNYFSETPIR
ncbi:sulfotransferase family protein [Flavobacterium sp. XGLA_31]|uniref:sulfotransferase family protein n=1 Tax=Flavobacterium sp. XGLA_31 TaxID=3447666 RepID=UPI003F3D102F